MVQAVSIRVAGIKFEASFLILEVGDSYDMLQGRPWLRRPWLRATETVHVWGTDELTIKQGSKKVTITTAVTQVPKANRPEEVFIAESDDLWKKLEENNIVPVATLDLNW